MNCLFCRIIARELPAEILYEDADIISVLDIYPSQKGHTLVIPKLHVEDFLVADDVLLATCARLVKKIAPVSMVAVGAEGFNLLVNTRAAAGQVIFHLHWHIIPRFSGDGLRHWPPVTYEEGESARIADGIRSRIHLSV